MNIRQQRKLSAKIDAAYKDLLKAPPKQKPIKDAELIQSIIIH